MTTPDQPRQLGQEVANRLRGLADDIEAATPDPGAVPDLPEVVAKLRSSAAAAEIAPESAARYIALRATQKVAFLDSPFHQAYAGTDLGVYSTNANPNYAALAAEARGEWGPGEGLDPAPTPARPSPRSGHPIEALGDVADAMREALAEQEARGYRDDAAVLEHTTRVLADRTAARQAAHDHDEPSHEPDAVRTLAAEWGHLQAESHVPWPHGRDPIDDEEAALMDAPTGLNDLNPTQNQLYRQMLERVSATGTDYWTTLRGLDAPTEDKYAVAAALGATAAARQYAEEGGIEVNRTFATGQGELTTTDVPMAELRTGDRFVGPDERTVYEVTQDSTSHERGWVFVRNLDVDPNEQRADGTPAAEGFFDYSGDTPMHKVRSHGQVADAGTSGLPAPGGPQTGPELEPASGHTTEQAVTAEASAPATEAHLSQGETAAAAAGSIDTGRDTYVAVSRGDTSSALEKVQRAQEAVAATRQPTPVAEPVIGPASPTASLTGPELAR